MKKILTIFAAVVFAFSFACSSYSSVDSIYEVAVVSVKGDVQVDTNGDGTWIRPWIGMKLMVDALVKTGEDSTVDIVFDAEGMNLARIKANSLTTVKKALLELPEGTVFASFANLKPGSSFTVKTPTAACAIRGSAMGVEVRGGVTTGLAFQGNLYVQPLDSAGNPVGPVNTVPEGNKTNVGAGGNMGGTESLSGNDMNAFGEFQSGGTDGTGLGGEPDDVDGEVDAKDLDEIKVDVKDEDDSKVISPTGEGISS